MIFVLNCEVLDENLSVENLTSILMDVASIRDLLVYVYHPRATTNGCILSKSTRTAPFQMLEEDYQVLDAWRSSSVRSASRDTCNIQTSLALIVDSWIEDTLCRAVTETTSLRNTNHWSEMDAGDECVGWGLGRQLTHPPCLVFSLRALYDT